MFQRLSNLLFGEVEEVAAELKGPKPCVTEADEEGWMLVNLPEGATAEASPMEDLLIEHPSMSVYVSPNNLSIVSNGNLSMVSEESIMSMASSVSTVAEPAAAPATHTPGPFRVTFGPYVQSKVAQGARIHRGKARIERRHLSRNRIQRQNRTREQVPRHASHARNTFLHQPSKRNFCH
ncbi:tumor protein p53-inducible nuclear protein 2 isoform X2 [Dunckerocampus dactyliophorus]|uniref:tumor protein p53-inducible nuclear protein 2 isoform X2 n=1 Tax=Dunckerocampus dactyliophorus TaxID=161453 RepID=UPI00240752AE|nr:tumor protein p53-inducible nuclear protein 2 isoform X2 [Dunckerocampus dactyliophorus]